MIELLVDLAVYLTLGVWFGVTLRQVLVLYQSKRDMRRRMREWV